MKKHWPLYLIPLYVFAAITWSMPPQLFPMKKYLDPVIARPFMLLNLWQSWDMFAPNPRNEDIWVEVVTSYSDGSLRSWPITKMVEMPYLERWQKERWRKYFNDHLRTDAEQILWQPFVEYWVRALPKDHLRPKTIRLLRWWRSSEQPIRPELRASKREGDWKHYQFHQWQIPENFL